VDFEGRLNAVIPGGAQTYSRGFDQFPSNAPQILARGRGAYVWDVDDRRYLDYGMGLRAVTIGYADPRVNSAAWRQMQRGNNLTRASMIELEAAEQLVDLIPSVEMVKFAKNGSNVTTAATKIARSFTERRYICVPRQQPFFSFDDWFIGTTAITRGIPTPNYSFTLQFDYGDICSLEALFDEYPGEIAGVMLEPATTLTPCKNDCDRTLSYETCRANCPQVNGNFLHAVEQLCQEENALFILDEMITGFRWHIKGAAHYFGVKPDLITFGKGMANGFSVAAVGGRRDVMEVGSIDRPGTERTFLLSSTHGGEMGGLGAFVETVAIYQEKNVIQHMWNYGNRLRVGLESIASEMGVAENFLLDGPDICLSYVLRDGDGEVSLSLRTLFAQEMIKGGVIMPWISLSLAHDEAELDKTLGAASNALKIISKAVAGGVDNFLVGSAIKPVFRKHN
jgi:glutamate-1-semialdehyde 2,1-aminomutase